MRTDSAEGFPDNFGEAYQVGLTAGKDKVCCNSVCAKGLDATDGAWGEREGGGMVKREK